MDQAVRLPQVPSKLIRLALNDLREVEREEGYAVEMCWWHYFNKGYGVCYVCLAGAVLARTMRVHRKCSRTLRDVVDLTNKYALCALDDFRCGCISGGLATLGISHDWTDGGLPPHVDIAPYPHVGDHDAIGVARFYADMEALAAMLERAGY